jgi:hypothetical protein
MSPQKPNAHAPGADNRRRHDRMNYHTAVTVIADGPDGFCCIRSRSSDLSATGVKIVCHEPLTTPSVFLRILLPELSERFVEAEVVNNRREELERIGHPSHSRYIYGLRFKSFVSDRGMLDRLRIASVSHSSAAAP